MSIRSTRLLVAVAASAALAFSTLAGAAPQAHATPPPPPPVITTETKTVSASSSTSSSAYSVNGVSSTVKTTIVLEYIQSKGATKTQTKKAKTIKLKKAKCLRTSYRNTAGKTVWHTKCYKKGHKFYKGKDGYWHDKPCWNKVVGLPKGKKKVVGAVISTKTKVKIVREHVWTIKSFVSVKGTAKATAKASCPNINVSAEASSEATYYAGAWVSASGTSKTTTEAILKGRVKSYSTKTQESLKGQAWTKAWGGASASAKAQVTCEEKPPPPPANNPPSVDLKGPKHLYVDGTYCAKIYGSDPEDKANVVLTYTIAGPASFVDRTSNCSKRDDTENSQRVITVPVKAGSSPGEVTITAVVKDSKGETATKQISFPVLGDDFPQDAAKSLA